VSDGGGGGGGWGRRGGRENEVEDDTVKRRMTEKGGGKLVVVVAAAEENGLGVRKREKNVWSEKVDWKGLMAIKSQKCQIGLFHGFVLSTETILIPLTKNKDFFFSFFFKMVSKSIQKLKNKK
jgi:hypothetical protein